MNESNSSTKHYDMVVIGSGAAGHHGAIQAAKLGKKVAVVERSVALGGASINTGTIPSKTLREAILRSARSGCTDRRVSVSNLAQRIEEVASNEVRVFENQFRRNDIDVLIGTATFSGAHTIRVANQEEEYFCHADHILIATGSRPAHNDAIPVDDASIIDTDAIRRLRTEHHVLTIVGGGVIGIEYACIAAALDIPVTLIERRPRILDFVIGFPSLSSVAMEQGRVAVCHAFGVQVVSVSELFPYGIYSIPEISFVGKTEEHLTEAGVSYEIGIAHYREIARGQIINDTTGLLKILFHRETRQLLGVHIVGEGATELIHIGQAVIGFEGTIDSLINTVFNYPTLAECYKVAALNGLNRLNFSASPH